MIGKVCQYLAVAVTIAAALTVNVQWLPWFSSPSSATINAISNQLATFNAALFPGVPEVEERTALLVQQLQRSSADVFCLQEVWLTETQRKVYQGVKDHYPYIVTSIDLTQDPNEDKSPACDGASIQLVGTCIATFCNDTDSQSACFIQHCQSILRQLSQPCLTCLTIGRRGLQCSADPAGLYKSSFGLMLLSKKKFTNVKVKSYLPDYASNLRGHIQANVDGIGDVICTHLSTVVAPIYIGPPYTDPYLFLSYAEQQYDELLKLFKEIESLKLPIIMGDFNHGPASPGNKWELPFHYGLINARGFVSPYVLSDGRCTWCKDNPIIAQKGYSDNLVIDHIYVTTTSLSRVESTMRIFDNLTTANGIPLSDHYGVQVTIRRTDEGAKDPTTMLSLPPPQGQLNDLCLATSNE